MIKFRTGVKIRSGIKMGHSESVEENPLDIRFNRDFIYIKYNGADYIKMITYTQGFGKTADSIEIEEPTPGSEVYREPFPPEDYGALYNWVMATAWGGSGQSIASNRLVFQL